jgi:hypothetical protein
MIFGGSASSSTSRIACATPDSVIDPDHRREFSTRTLARGATHRITPAMNMPCPACGEMYPSPS